MKIVIPVEVYSRVCGYFRPVNHWNKGKKEEFYDRLNYKLPNKILIENEKNFIKI